MLLVYLFAFLLLIAVWILASKVIELNKGKHRVEQELKQTNIGKISPFGTVKKLTILPLVEFYSDRADLKTEPGVSYLITADDTTILLDVGYNVGKEHPSPLIANAEKLTVDLNSIDMIFISHTHLDHIGGMKEQSEKTFSLSQGTVKLPEIPVFAPDNIAPSKWNPGLKVKVVSQPLVLKPGIASTGAIPRQLFIIGYTSEQSLVVNVEGKGVVLIVGCGHQTVERLTERVRQLFDEPIYAIIGGLHYPVKGGRIMKGPFNIQHVVGSDNPPWRGLSEQNVIQDINILKKINPHFVALSAHDSSDWSIKQFKEAFENRYLELKVGKEINL